MARRLVAASSAAVALLAGVLFAVTASIDLVTGPELSFSLFYLMPVAVAAVRWGRIAGYVAALFAAAVWLLVGFWSGLEYSHPAIPYWNALIRLGFFALVVYLLSRLSDAAKRADELARTDPVTGLPNRRSFEELALRECGRVQRLGTSLALAIVDVDDFKMINDRHGHAAGDEVLRGIGQVAGSRLRAIDITARIGGDEFAILLPDINQDDIRGVLERFTSVLASEDHGPSITCSIGVAHLSGGPLVEAYRAADDALYLAKQAGKNRIEIVELFSASVGSEPV